LHNFKNDRGCFLKKTVAGGVKKATVKQHFRSEVVRGRHGEKGSLLKKRSQHRGQKNKGRFRQPEPRKNRGVDHIQGSQTKLINTIKSLKGDSDWGKAYRVGYKRGGQNLPRMGRGWGKVHKEKKKKTKNSQKLGGASWKKKK